MNVYLFFFIARLEDKMFRFYPKLGWFLIMVCWLMLKRVEFRVRSAMFGDEFYSIEASSILNQVYLGDQLIQCFLLVLSSFFYHKFTSAVSFLKCLWKCWMKPFIWSPNYYLSSLMCQLVSRFLVSLEYHVL